MSLWPRESIETKTFWDKATRQAVKDQFEDGADKNARNKNGETPLHFAAMVGKLEAFHCLIEARPKINPHSLDGTTPLHIAVGREETIITLLDLGADGRDCDSNELTPFDRFANAHKSLKGSKIYWLLNDARYSNKIMRLE